MAYILYFLGHNVKFRIRNYGKKKCGEVQVHIFINFFFFNLKKKKNTYLKQIANTRSTIDDKTQSKRVLLKLVMNDI